MGKGFLHPLIAATAAYLTKHQMLKGVTRLGVAVSGGADSMALLHVLAELSGESGIELVVSHVHHGLRGRDSDEDEEFVRNAAEGMGLAFHLRRMDAGAAPATGVEAWARDQRLDFFRGLIERGVCQRVATGHTQRDQAETVLFRLLRGAGAQGLGGISAVSERGLIRPLLWASREDVLDYLRKTGADWREDKSNLDAAFARNRLRNEWLPALRKAWNPRLDRSLAQSAEILNQESAYLDRIADGELVRLFGESRFGWEAAVPALREVELAVMRRVLRRLVYRVAATTLDFERLEEVRELSTGRKGSGRFEVQGLVAERSNGHFRIAARPARDGEPLVAEALDISGPGRFWLREGEVLELVALPADEERMNRFNGLNSGYTEGWSILRTAGRGCVLRLRIWRPGEVFQPVGASSASKLKELFQRRQVPRWRRAEAVLLEMDGEIAWCQHLGLSAAHASPVGDGANPPGQGAWARGWYGMALRFVEECPLGEPRSDLEKSDEWESTSSPATS